MTPFVVLTLPRCRSYWLSRFLSYGAYQCAHEEVRHLRGMDDVRAWLSLDCAGTVETAAAPFWRLIRHIRPETKIVVVRRPVAEVVGSLIRTGIAFDVPALTQRMHRLDAKLAQIAARVPDALAVTFADLATEEGCAGVFEHCLPYKHDHAWWERIAPVNLQTDLRALFRYNVAFATQMRRLEGVCRQESRALLWRKTSVADMDGMTFQEEPLASFWAGAQALFAEHCLAVGEPPDSYQRKNLTLIEKLANIGAWQFMTARCNGRMFGYLATLLGPDLEDPDTKLAVQTLFYASKDVRGLGLKLQRASVAALEAHGGKWKIVQRAGPRGDGPRMSALYRRMGAEDHGHLFKITLEAA